MKLKALIKPLISLAMLFMVLRFVHFETLIQTLLGIPVYVILLVVVGYAAGQVLNSYKWWIIARAGKIDVPYTTALKSYFIGTFANSFGLGTVGGDLTRALLLAAGRPVKTAAVASVVADRTFGLAVLACIGTAAAVYFGVPNVDQSWSDVLVVIGLSILLGWFYGPRILLKLVPHGNPLRTKAEAIAAVFPKERKTILYLTFLSASLHLLQIALHWVMGLAFGLDLPWPAILVAVPFVNMMASLPISWNGLGVREASYLFFLTPLPLTKEEAVVFGTIWLLAVTISSAIGGLIAVWTGKFKFVFRRPQ